MGNPLPRYRLFAIHWGTETIIDFDECELIAISEDNKNALQAIEEDYHDLASYLADARLTPETLRKKLGYSNG